MIGLEHQVFSEGSPGFGYGGLLALLNRLDSAQGSTATLRTPAPTRSWWMCRSPMALGGRLHGRRFPGHRAVQICGRGGV